MEGDQGELCCCGNVEEDGSVDAGWWHCTERYSGERVHGLHD
jgi:hypothetical protein